MFLIGSRYHYLLYPHQQLPHRQLVRYNRGRNDVPAPVTGKELLYRCTAPLSGSYPDTLFERGNKYFSIANLSGTMTCGLNNGINGDIDKFVVDSNIYSDFWNEIGRNFLTPVDFNILLPTMTGYATDGNSGYISLNQGFANMIEPVRLNDCCYQFHCKDLIKVDKTIAMLAVHAVIKAGHFIIFVYTKTNCFFNQEEKNE